MHTRRFILLTVLSVIIFSHSIYAWAEVIAGEAISFDISRDGLQSRMEVLEAKSGIDPDSKAREMNWYQLADKNIADQQWFTFLAVSYQEILKTAPDRLKAQIPVNKSQKIAAAFNIDQPYSEEELELLIINSSGQLRVLNDKISKLESELSHYINRPQHIREETLLARQQLKQAKLEFSTARLSTENKYEYQAHQVYLHTLNNALSATFKKLELETASNPLQIQLNKREQETLRVQQNHLQHINEQQEALLKTLQLAKADSLEQQSLKTARESTEKHAVIQQIIQANIHWSRDLQATIRVINQYENDTDKIEAYKRVVEEDYKNAEKKIKLAGLNPILGRVLRKQRNTLASNKQQYQNQINITEETGLISLALYRIELRQKQLLNPQAELELQVEQVQLSAQREKLSPGDIQLISQELLALLNEQKGVLVELSNAYLKKLRVLGDYQFANKQLQTLIDQYASYLDERLLWVPSSLPINLDYPLDIYHSLHWFFLPTRWLLFAQNIQKIIKTKLLMSSFALAGLLFLMYINNGIRNKICDIRENVGKPYTDNIYYTFQVLLFNIILSIPIPLLLFYLSWLLSYLPFHNDFSRAVGTGLHHTAIVLTLLQFFKIFLEDQGIAELHFRWQKKTVCLVRKQLAWMQFIIIPCVFIIYMTSATNAAEHSDSLGRLGLIIFISTLLIFAIRLFQPRKGILNDYFNNNTQLWWANLRYIWLILFISIPLIILGFSMLGYYISALELQQKSILTIRMIFITIIVYNIIIRWLGLTKRELALKNARNISKAEELNTQASESANIDAVVIVDDELIDIPKINEQTEKIINVLISTILVISIWLIWKNILPAFSFIDNIVLWQQIVIVNAEETIQSVTLTNLFIACFYIFLIGISVINFPGVMEIFIFRTLDVEAGSRYAINQLAKYALLTLGFILVAHELGGSWSKVQWLVAALTVGLGFGLQEIFANMVSGIILLFERPIRVGDTVTVDNITGKVTRIQMRATTIIDWDHKELIVPNKTFITQQLVNWTLTDPVTRIVIQIGISYGSDIDIAYKIISATVCATPLVLEEPKPTIYFLGFGDSSLDFSIRVYVHELADRLPVTHDIHIRLLKALRQQGIDIPFPQRDLHIQTAIQTGA